MADLRHLLATILLLTPGAALAAEEPRYTVIRTEATFEVRRYEPYLVAESLVAGSADEASSQGFRALAGYIFGKNKGARGIALTAPVAASDHGSAASIVSLPARNLPVGCQPLLQAACLVAGPELPESTQSGQRSRMRERLLKTGQETPEWGSS